MKTLTALTFAAFILGSLTISAPAQITVPVETFFAAASPAGAANPREDELYNAGQDYLNQSNWGAALDQFTQMAALKGPRADAALYYQAYALNKLGRRQEALGKIAELRRQYPKSTWLKDAGALEIEIRQASGQTANPQAQEDEELKILAINSLMNSDPERAIPEAKRVLESGNSQRVKSQALFVLAQTDRPEAKKIVRSIALGQTSPELQRKAIEFVATQGSASDREVLGEIYRTSPNPDIRRHVLDMYVACDCRKEALQAAQQEKDPQLRRHAIEMLGAMGDASALKQIFESSNTTDDKKAALQGMMIAGDVADLEQAARSAADPQVRIAAIHQLGVCDSKKAAPMLTAMYGAEKDKQTKRAIAEGLFTLDDAHDLITLARQETDPEMKRHLVQQLSVMDNKEAHEYMLELLNK